MTRLALAVPVALWCLALPVVSLAQQTNTLDSLRQSYEKQEQALLSGYGKALDGVLADLKKKGDLDNVLVLQAEQKRFEAEKTVPAPADSKDSFRLAAESYHKAMATLLGKYVTALDGLMKKEVAADRIEEAKAVQDEKKKVSFLLADSEVKVPKPEPLKVELVNAARNAKVEVNRFEQGNGSPDKVNDGVTNDVAWWYGGGSKPQPDWVRLSFTRPVEARSIRIMTPVATSRFPNGHEPLDYEVLGLNGTIKATLASVKNGKHPKVEPGPVSTVQWIVVELKAPKVLDGVQLTVKRTSGLNMGPVIFEIEVWGVPKEK